MAIEIPIKNIYYMLCYSYDILEEKENITYQKRILKIYMTCLQKYLLME